MKRSRRGPYRRIRWFCEDGTVHPPNPYPCEGRGGGVQHGQLSAGARRLGAMGFHVGQLLVELSFEEFIDAGRNHYRLRELVLQHYLRRVDDGWVYRRARYYRGARQAEDEAAAGRRLLVRLLSDSTWVRRHYLLAVELTRTVPHGQREGLLERIRGLAERVAELDSSFQRIRTKIHTDPDSGDAARVEAYLRDTAGEDAGTPGEEGAGAADLARELLGALREYYGAEFRERIDRFAGQPPFHTAKWEARFRELAGVVSPRGPGGADPDTALRRLSRLSSELRQAAETSSNGAHNLLRLDLVLAIQRELFRQATRLSPGGTDAEPESGGSRRAHLSRLRSLLRASFGRGYLARPGLRAQLRAVESLLSARRPSAARYHRRVSYLARATGWMQSSVQRAFGHTAERYAAIEPKAEGFAGDLLRAGVALPLERLLARLSGDARRVSGLTHRIGGQEAALPVRGVHPGVAVGVLRVRTAGPPDPAELRSDDIYLLPATVRELPPVGGLLTLSGGGALSHVQILARNLGIPTASVEPAAAEEIRALEGDSVLYAVSPRGRVTLRRVSQLDSAGRRLARSSAGDDRRRLRVDAREIHVGVRRVLSLEEIPVRSTGSAVGPKARELAGLRRRFPDRVPPALVVPYGLYRQHLEAAGPPGGAGLYEEIRGLQARSERARRSGRSLHEDSVRRRLARFRREIRTTELDSSLVRALRGALADWTGEGSAGVFVRSDTNVEDLPRFSGAGLNLTVPHRIGFSDVLRALKRVWASPFTWRAWTWRRRTLANPRPVHVSVLLQRSVPADRSGVLATTGLQVGGGEAVTISTAEGVAGAVAGEAAETLAVTPGGRVRLISPYRAAYRKQLVYEGAGGIRMAPVSGAPRVLTDARARRVASLADTLRRELPPATDRSGRELPWDVEFGFEGDKLWLFQVRPFAGGSTSGRVKQLARLDAGLGLPADRRVDLDRPPLQETRDGRRDER